VVEDAGLEIALMGPPLGLRNRFSIPARNFFGRY